MADNVIIPGEEDAGNIILPAFELGNEYNPGAPIQITNPKEKVIILPDGLELNGALTSGEANSRYVRYDLPQSLTEAGKAQARTNIGIVGTGPHSSGMVVEPGLVDNGDGTVTVLSEDANVYKTNDWTGGLFVYTIPALANIQLTDNTTNYIVVNYNSGSPAYQTITNVTLINESNIIPVFTIERIGLKLRLLPWDSLANGKSDRMHARFVKTRRFERNNNEGLVVSEFGTRNLRIETGRVWYGANTIDLSLVLSTINDFEQYYNVGGVWNLVSATQWNNTQYDDGTDLQTMTAGKFGVVWLYRGVEVDSHGLMVLGNQEYDTEAEARTAGIRADLPSSINTNSMLVSQLIFLKDAATLSDIRSPFNTIFTSANPTSHNSLAGLQLAGNGITYGHINDQAQNIVGPKTYSDIVSSPNFQSTVVTGTEPYATNSVTLNTNLNADLLDGKHATEFAAFDYLDNVDNIQQVPLNYLDTDVLLTANSDVRVATQRAIKTYVNGLVDNTLKAPEPYNPTITSAFPTTYGGDPIEKGDSFRITAAGTMNGVIVNPEDLLIALIDLPGNTPSNWQVVESNRDQATEVTLGVAKIATQVQVDAGTENLSFVTPLKLQTKLNTDLANVAYKNQANLFTANQTIDGSLNIYNGNSINIFADGGLTSKLLLDGAAGSITGGVNVDLVLKTRGNSDAEGFSFVDASDVQKAIIYRTGGALFSANVTAQSYSIGGTTVIDASRNVNANQIIANTNQALTSKLTGFKSSTLWHDSSNNIFLTPSTSVNGVDWDFSKAVGFNLDTGELSGSTSLNFNTYKVGGTTVIDASLNIVNAGSVAIGATTARTKLDVVSGGAQAISGDMNTGIVIGNGYGESALNMGNFANQYSWLQSAYTNNAGAVLPLALNPNGGLVTCGAGIDVTGTVTATSFIKPSGTAAQFLKADGSVDNNTYLTSGLTLKQVTDAGNNTSEDIIIGDGTYQSAALLFNGQQSYTIGTDNGNFNNFTIANGGDFTSKILTIVSDGSLVKIHDDLEISDVLRITPQSSAPTSPSLGWIYVNTDTHIYFYNGTSWVQMDN